MVEADTASKSYSKAYFIIWLNFKNKFSTKGRLLKWDYRMSLVHFVEDFWKAGITCFTIASFLK